MRHALNALTDELRRMKTSGVKVVAISEESVATLRRTLQARRGLPPFPLPRKCSCRLRGLEVSSVVPKAYEPPPMARFRKLPRRPRRRRMPAPPEITLPKGDKQARWNALLAQVRADPICQRQLRPGKRVVLGVGTLDAKIMFVGEAPGAEENCRANPCRSGWAIRSRR
jgi:DNA polymerase